MKVAFHTSQLSLRGTEVALYDYAYFNQTILGNESLIFCQERPDNEPSIREKFQSQFECIFYQEFQELDKIAERRGVELTYFIKSGVRDGLLLLSTRNAIHAVFPTVEQEWHGDRFAFVSRWLSVECSNSKVPFVPHIVTLPPARGDLREELNIPARAMVYGCHGGRDSFDIMFVKDVVAQADTLLPNRYFVFLNIAPFCDHPQVRFLPGTSLPRRKVAFINTCNAMLHARGMGESFGLACAEFSLLNKPVLTFGRSDHRCHIDLLGDAAFVYRNRKELIEILKGLSPSQCGARSWDQYSKEFAPAVVMEQFRKVFLCDRAALPRLGLQDKFSMRIRSVAQRLSEKLPVRW